jgi:hypothetical protein
MRPSCHAVNDSAPREAGVGENKFADVAAASECFLPWAACRTTALFFASASRGLTYASDVIAARKLRPI